MLNRTLNENPSVHVYETISVYGKNNDFQQQQQARMTAATELEFYNNLILFPNSCEEFSRDGKRISTKFVCDNNNRSFKQNNNKNDKSFLTTFYNNFNDDENRIITNSNNFSDADSFRQQDISQQQIPFGFFNVRTQSRFNNGNQNLYPPSEAVV